MDTTASGELKKENKLRGIFSLGLEIPAPGQDQICAGDLGSFGREKVTHRGSDLLEGDRSTGRKGARRRKSDAVIQITRGDEVYGDLAADQFRGKGAGEERDTGFTDVISGGHSSGVESIPSGIPQIDDPASGFWKKRKGALGCEKNRSCGAFQTRLPILETGTEEGGGAVGARVVDQDIQTAESFANLEDHAVHVLGAGQIGPDDFGWGSLGTKLPGQPESRLHSAPMVKD